MARTIEAVTIVDREGNGHTYTQTLFPAEEGLALATEIAALLGPALGKALAQSGEGGLASLATAQIDLAGAVSELARALPSAPGVAARLLKYTRRDGQPLSDKGAFSLAYSGNYAELTRACVWVVRENGFLDFLSGFSGIGSE